MKFLYLALLSVLCLNLVGCAVEPVYPAYYDEQPVWVDGYWGYNAGVRVWVDGRWDHHYHGRGYHGGGHYHYRR